MSTLALSNLEQSVREQVSRSESAVDSLEADLRAIDVELLALAEDHNKYEKLEQICSSLEELDEVGAGHLFWDEVEGTGRQLALRRFFEAEAATL